MFPLVFQQRDTTDYKIVKLLLLLEYWKVIKHQVAVAFLLCLNRGGGLPRRLFDCAGRRYHYALVWLVMESDLLILLLTLLCHIHFVKKGGAYFSVVDPVGSA